MPLPEQNLIVCHGDDEMALARFVNSLILEMGDDALADSNISRLDGNTGSLTDLANVVMSMPFFQPHRLVLLTNPFARMGKEKNDPEETGSEEKQVSSSSWSTELKRQFLELLGNIPDTTKLVLIIEDSLVWNTKAKKNDWGLLKSSHFLTKWINDHPDNVLMKSFLLPDEKQMHVWIQKEAADRKIDISRAAAAELAGYVGNDTRLAGLELDKLALYVNGKRPIDVEDVNAISTFTPTAKIWGLVDAIGQKNAHQAVKIYHQLLETLEVGYEIFPMIIRQFRQMIVTRETMDSRGSAQELIGKFGITGYGAPKLWGQVGNIPMSALESYYFQLMKIEEDTKNGLVDLETALDTFIVTACGQG